jgi:hypothetical protein
MNSGDYVAWGETLDDRKKFKDSSKDGHIEENVRHLS